MTTALGERTLLQHAGPSSRRAAPVFVVGCPRSGTTLLYHMLLSAGGFVVYRAESHAFDLLAHRFGSLKSARNRKSLADAWLNSKAFHVSGLEEEEVRDAMTSSGSAGEILKAVMHAMARRQGITRWADTTPDHLLYMCEIKRQIPDALFIHIIRDGRDVALSFAQQGWSRPLPWDKGQELSVAALYWQWAVQRGQRSGRELDGDYLEVSFEDVVGKPREALSRIGGFIDHALDYERIQNAGIGSVRSPNTSFASDTVQFNPVERWKKQMSQEQLFNLELLIGNSLQQLGYPLGNDASGRKPSFQVRRMRSIYPTLFSAKLWLKDHTPLGRFADTSVLNWGAE
jgi:hypothetical protein